MSRIPLPHVSDSVVRVVAPIDQANQVPLDGSSGATCEFRIYDPNKDQVLSQDAANTDTVLNVSGAGVYVVDDQIQVTLDDGSLFVSVATAVDSVAGTITLGAGLTGAAGAGNRVRRKFDSTVVMDPYGNSSLAGRDWGFQGTIADDSEAVSKLDQELNIDIHFVGSPSGGLTVRRTVCAIVKPFEECDCE